MQTPDYYFLIRCKFQRLGGLCYLLMSVSNTGGEDGL